MAYPLLTIEMPAKNPKQSWNTVDTSARSSHYVASFKRIITTRSNVPSYYLAGNRKGQILRTRLRTSCSSLNYCLLSKNIVNNKFCTCGEIEDTKHYLLYCPQYAHYRATLMENISRYCNPTLNILLFGDPAFNREANTFIFETLEVYIMYTKQFV